jgi:hypothetical protein
VKGKNKIKITGGKEKFTQMVGGKHHINYANFRPNMPISFLIFPETFFRI